MNSSGLAWRWVALVAVAANAALNYATQRAAAELPSIGEISAKYQAQFTPASYAFSIWGLIYLGFGAYAVFSLMPSQRALAVHDRLAGWLVVYAIAGVLWTELFRRELIGASLAVIAGMFAIGAWMFGLAHDAARAGVVTRWVRMPFAIYFGWISVATIANAATWAVARHAFVTPAVETRWTLAFVAAAGLLGVLVSWRYRVAAYSAVVTWALVAIWVAQREANPLVGYFALAASAAVVFVGLVGAVLAVKNRTGSAA